MDEGQDLLMIDEVETRHGWGVRMIVEMDAVCTPKVLVEMEATHL